VTTSPGLTSRADPGQRPSSPEDSSDSPTRLVAQRVTRESNLIARNLACLGARQAAEATAEHIRRFWAPQLRAALLEQAERHPQRFSPVASAAVGMLRTPPATARRSRSADHRRERHDGGANTRQAPSRR
jgi:formate dehydrogenase subunit delta